MDMKSFFERAIELREEYAEKEPYCREVLTMIVTYVFKYGEPQRGFDVEHPFNGRFYNLIPEESFQKVLNDLGLNYHLSSYRELPTCTQRMYRATFSVNRD